MLFVSQYLHFHGFGVLRFLCSKVFSVFCILFSVSFSLNCIVSLCSVWFVAWDITVRWRVFIGM